MKTREQIARISRSKKRFRISIIAAAILVLATVLSIVILRNNDTGGTTVSNNTSGNIELLEGEGMYIGTATAYPSIKGKDIQRITIKNKAEKGNHYTLVRDSEMANGDFLFAYYEDGEVKVFMPSICEEDSTHTYSDLYAIETEDGYGMMTKVSYLVTALQAPYFKHRIAVSDNPKEREEAYSEFGFTSDKAVTIEFDYTAEDGGKKTHKIVIGDKVPTGIGYYFMVDDRPYIYNSTVNYFDYALAGFYSFVNTTLVAKGLEQDSTYEPLFTSNFTHWENTVVTDPDKKITSGADVVFTSKVLTPVMPSEFIESPGSFNDMQNGYRETAYSQNIFEMLNAGEKSLFKNAFLGNGIQTFFDTEDESSIANGLHLTFTNDYHESKAISFTESTMTYAYEIVEIEAIVLGYEDAKLGDIVAGDSRIAEYATPDANGEYKYSNVKVAYYFTVNGKRTTELLSHAVINLDNDLIPKPDRKSIRDAIAEWGLGELPEGKHINFYINYTKDNVKKTPYDIVITEIVTILDSNNNTISKVDENSTVGYKYLLNVNGQNDGVEYFHVVYLADARTESELRLRDALVGKKAGSGLSVKVSMGEVYSEVFEHFTTYVISSIDYFITREQKISFSFLNASDRDPFYGDSIYKNKTQGKELYGLNAANCEQVAKFLGGALGENTTVSQGLFGTEVLDIGITPEKMKEYGPKGSEGLFAHTVYFEIPRGISAIGGSAEDELDDYTAYDKIGFTLYVSDLDSDGMRYIASENYDIITKIDNSVFFFLDESFVDFWAKKNIILTNVDHMLEMKFEFNMDDLKGAYTLDISHNIADVYENLSGQIQIGGTPPYEDAKPIINDYDFIKVTVTPEGECTENELTKYLDANNKQSANLNDLYYTTTPKEQWYEYFPDYYGTTYFKEFVRKIFYMTYEGAEDATVGEGENEEPIQKQIMGDYTNYLMKFSLKIDSDKDGKGEDEIYYSYEFYRYSDRRVLVRIYREKMVNGELVEIDHNGKVVATGEASVSDFYLSVNSFKALVNTYVMLMNGVSFEIES